MLDTTIGIGCLVLAVLCWFGYLWASKNVYLKCKEQKVGVRTRWWRR